VTTGFNYLPPPLIRPPAPSWQPAEEDRPVYVEAQPVRAADKPEPLEAHDRTRALAAANQARKRFPGPAGEVLANEITAWHHFGFRGDANSPTARLIRELTASEQA
jgi:hypothetical protein